MIRKLAFQDYKTASEVLWKSFYYAEKNIHSLQGMETFRDLTTPVSLSISEYDGLNEFYGYFLEEKMVAVGAIKEKKHVLMLYVLPEFQGRGIGIQLLSFLENICTSSVITLLSSDGALEFYKKNGYFVNGPRQIKDELIGTPMKKVKKKLNIS